MNQGRDWEIQTRNNELQSAFRAYQDASRGYLHPTIRETLRRALFSSAEEASRTRMLACAGNLRTLLSPGTLLRIVEPEGKPSRNVIIGRRMGEYSVSDVKGLSLYANQKEGDFIPADAFIDLSGYRGVEVLHTRHAPRTKYVPRENID